ncbi:hypothetical protein AG1IA_09233 [Rhizoctonia solani AG-1 IA]|uniref:Uncharacterized protein n=1 Tax=Thanatephorus cucumeris (strain AG1-IA) TaxID=983506 RepID=L8WFJ2_THACA|nr:hypothetical protein AG1IA_09233 [Rhizoctonia solani AG-1 IA]
MGRSSQYKPCYLSPRAAYTYHTYLQISPSGCRGYRLLDIARQKSMSVGG